MTYSFGLLLICMCFGQLAFAQAKEPEAVIKPADVYKVAAAIQQDIELLRQETGRAQAKPSFYKVRKVAPREVYYHALEVLRKSIVFGKEFEIDAEQMPAVINQNPKPGDVHSVLERALINLRNVKSTLGVSGPSFEQGTDSTKKPTDVLTLLIQVNKQLEAISLTRVRSREVYSQLSYAFELAQLIHKELAPVGSSGKKPDFERAKTPADCFDELIECYSVMGGIAKKYDFTLLELEKTPHQAADVCSVDVIDMISMLTSQLQLMRLRLNLKEHPNRHYFPGRIYPSHIFQRARQLRSLLQETLEIDKQ